ncbi:unnamed protein product, partial [Medioppia subpectinata]
MRTNLEEGDMHLIEEHLYLGNIVAAQDPEALKEHNISYILSVFDDELSVKCDSLTYMQIRVYDMYDEDLLTHLPEAIQFIEAARGSGKGVLVHCHMGYSRSATVVIGYLMSKTKQPYEPVYDMVRAKRLIGPNKGFRNQLSVFAEMGFTLNAKNRKLRQFMVETLLTSDTFWKKWENKVNAYFARLELIESMTGELDMGAGYVCHKCGHKLFNEIHVQRSTASEEDEWVGIDSDTVIDEKESCGYFYIEPQKWMTSLIGVTADDGPGLVKCPDCAQELIEYNDMFDPFTACYCLFHKNLLKSRRFRVADNKIKIES